MSLYDFLGECIDAFMNEKSTRQDVQNIEVIGMLGSLTEDSQSSSYSIPNLGPLRNQRWPSMLVEKHLLPCHAHHDQRRRVAYEEKMTYVSRIRGDRFANFT